METGSPIEDALQRNSPPSPDRNPVEDSIYLEQSGLSFSATPLEKMHHIRDISTEVNHSATIIPPANGPTNPLNLSAINTDKSSEGNPSVIDSPVVKDFQTSEPPRDNLFDSKLGDSNGLDSSARVLSNQTHEPSVTVVDSTCSSPVSLGAWAKPLSILPIPETCAISSHHLASKFPSPENWPSLKTSSQLQGKKKLGNRERAHQNFKDVLQGQNKPPVEKFEDAIRFPWAAKMNPDSRNLYRAIEPEFLEDGTPKVKIPKHVLLQGLENQKEYILGQFYRCLPPPGGLIFAVFNKIWGRNCKITIRKLGDSNYLFHIPDESTRSWVLQRGLWHVDDCLMFVAQWTPEASLDIPEIKTIPIWVSLKKIPSILYSIPGISHIASGLGAPMATHKPRLDPILIGEAKILVEVELSKAFPTRIAACDDNGFISMVDVEYAWLPTKCDTCGQLGHKVKRCLQSVKSAPVNAATDSTSSPTVPTSTPIVSTTRSDCVHVNLTTSKEVSKDKFVAASDGHLAAPDAGFVAAPAPEPEVTHEAAPEVVVIDEVPPEDQTVSALEVSAIVTKLAVTTEAAPSENETATPNEVVSTSHYVSSSGNNLRSTNAFEFSAIKENNRIGDLGNSDGSSSDSDSEYLYETTAATTSKRGRLVKPSQKKQQMDWTTIQRGRGNRGRGHRGRRGGRG